MNKNAHTPGPWQAINLSEYRTSIDTLDMTPVCNLEEPTPADARLIAAAPELLEALEAIEASKVAEESYRFTQIGTYPHDKRVPPELREQWLADLDAIAVQQIAARKKAQAAIAKARGLQ